MSLIIAIEPDREQAAQLQDLVRRHTRAELILADTTARAIGAMEERVPDLVLIPAFLSPQDDEALTEALRSHEAAQHVQTLTIPVLGEPQSRSGGQGVLSRLRGNSRPASPDSCDPRLFAEQITEYLERVAKDRGLATSGNGKGPHGNNGHKPGATPQAAGSKASAQGRPAAPAPVIMPTPPQRESATPPPNRLVAPPPPPRAGNAHPEPAAGAAGPSQHVADENSSPENENAPADDLATAMEAALASESDDDLEQGLSSLMEKLTAEDLDADQLTGLRNLESAEYAIPKDVMFREDSAARDPKDIPVTGASSPAPAQSDPAPAQKPAAPVQDDWGDILASLKKDLGR